MNKTGASFSSLSVARLLFCEMIYERCRSLLCLTLHAYLALQTAINFKTNFANGADVCVQSGYTNFIGTNKARNISAIKIKKRYVESVSTFRFSLLEPRVSPIADLTTAEPTLFIYRFVTNSADAIGSFEEDSGPQRTPKCMRNLVPINQTKRLVWRRRLWDLFV